MYKGEESKQEKKKVGNRRRGREGRKEGKRKGGEKGVEIKSLTQSVAHQVYLSWYSVQFRVRHLSVMVSGSGLWKV